MYPAADISCRMRECTVRCCHRWPVQCARSTGCVQPGSPSVGVRDQEAVGPVLIVLATQIKAVGETGLRRSNPQSGDPYPARFDYLLRQAYVGNRPEDKSTS